MSMMKVDIKEVVERSLHKGVDFETVGESLKSLARRHMLRHFEGLKQALKLPSSMTFEEFRERYHAEKDLRRRFADVRRNHVVAYIGEIAVHHALGRDWRLVFRFNNIRVYNMEDGFVDGKSYDVKTRHKNREGLSVESAKVHCDYYILCHLIGGFVHIIGFAEKDRLLQVKPRTDEYGKTVLCLEPRELQSFDAFLRLFKR